MKATILLLLLLLLGSRFAHAQSAAGAAPPDSLIKVRLVPSGRYPHVLYTLNDEPLTNSTIKTLLGKYPQSALELRKYKAQRRTALLVLLPVYMASMAVGLAQTYPHRTEPGSLFSKAPVPFSIALGAFFGSIAVLATNDHYEKAIEAYNAAAKARRR